MPGKYVCSIYKLTNTVNGKIYIGQTWDLVTDRMGKNGCNYKNSTYVYNAILKYGFNKFEHEILVECKDQESADYLEDYFMLQYDSLNHDIGYNIKRGGSVGKHSEETKRKISESLKNKQWSPEAIENRIEALHRRKGEKRPPKTKEESRAISERMKEWHTTHEHPMTGRHMTEEAKVIISNANKGKKISEEHRAKLSKACKMAPEKEQRIVLAYKNGDTVASIQEQFHIHTSVLYRVLHRNNITCERESNQWLGKKHTEKTKKKMSESKIEYWKEYHNKN